MCPVSKHLCRQGAFTLFNTWMDERGVTWKARRVMNDESDHSLKWTVHSIVCRPMQRNWPCKDLRSFGPTSHTSAKTRADSGEANARSGNATSDLAHHKDAEMASTLKYNMLWGTNNIALFLNNVEKDLMKTLKDWKTVRTFQMQRMEPETPRPDRTNLRCGNHGVDSRVYFAIGLQQNGVKPQNLACFAVWVLHEITME